MKNLIRTALALSLFVIITSCSDKEEDAHAATVKKFVGTWDYSYALNCGAGVSNFTDEIVITKSTDEDYDLYVVVPPVGGFDADMSIGGAGTNPFFFLYFEDANGVNTSITAFLSDGVLDVEGSTYDDSPSFYCAFYGTAEKQ